MAQIVPIPLTSGAYTSQSVIANYQRCVNLYPEANPPETKAPVPVTHYLAPGLKQLLQFPDNAQVRGLYQTSIGDLYAVCGASLYYIPRPVNGVWGYRKIGSLSPQSTQVKMSDNGQSMLVVDGTGTGYQVNLSNQTLGGITAVSNSGTNGFAYSGANFVDYTDTFLIGNDPGTKRWWASASDELKFDPLSFGSKSGSPDPLQAVVALQRYIMLIGTLATEWWYNAGGTNFPFALMSGPYVEHGAAAQYSVIKAEESVLFLSKSRAGNGIFLRINDFRAVKKSTFALEAEWLTYPVITDAVTFGFQLAGHTFIGVRFPSADKTWVYDMETDQWHERTTLDSDGCPHQWRVNTAAAAYGTVVGGDYANGKLYEINPKYTNDDGTPILRIRGFPHVVQGLARTRHNFVTADLACGEPIPSAAPPIPLAFDNFPGSPIGWAVENGGALYADPATWLQASLNDPTVYLRYSTSRGKSWSTLLPARFGLTGNYAAIVQWRRLSMSRDLVFEFSWVTPQITALNGAFIGPVPSVS